MLFHLRCFGTGIELGGKVFEDELGVLVGLHKIGRFELVHVDESGYNRNMVWDVEERIMAERSLRVASTLVAPSSSVSSSPRSGVWEMG